MANRKEKILVRGVNWLGDAIMSTPALLRLREAKPAAEIVLLTSEKLSGLWPGHPAIDRVITFVSRENVVSVARRLRGEGFETAIVFPNSPRAALEVFLARIPNRVGYSRPWRNWFLSRALPERAEEVRMHKRSPGEVRALIAGKEMAADRSAVPSRAHHMFQYLHLVESVGARGDAIAPAVAVSDEEVRVIRDRFHSRADAAITRKLIGINAGAEYGPAKRWPVRRFVEAAVGISRHADCSFWILGGVSDLNLAKEVATSIGAEGVASDKICLLAGQTSLRELCAALKACDVVLTNDTGPMHVAAAVGTPVVVPFGSTSWQLTGPGLLGDSRHRFLHRPVPCSPCFRRECPIDFRCMTGIVSEEAIQAMREVLGC
jgi:heptosyltransferase-2